MTSIRAFSDILLQGDEIGANDREKYAAIIQTEAIRLTRLLDDLLDLSVLENGRVDLKIQSVKLHDAIDQAIRTCAPIGLDNKLNIQRVLADEKITLRTDPDRLSQVFINLITNTLKYCTAQSPELDIQVQCLGDKVEIDFRDNGQGIPVESQPIIFEKFSRLGDQKAAGSAGLGLTICREVMANLQGTITYLPGQRGAAFRISLPLNYSDNLLENQ